MILHRLIDHLKGQHWTAVFLDFVIVVVGVFIGLQVNNWNQARIQNDALNRQLTSLRIEMEANLRRLGAWKKDEVTELKDIQFIRSSFTNGTGFEDAGAMNAKLMALAYVRQPNVDTSAYEILVNSGNLNQLGGTPLHKAILAWETARSELEHTHQTALTIRTMGTEALLGVLSFESIFEHFTSAQPYNAPPHFKNDFATLAGNRKLASYLALKTAVEVQTLSYIEHLETRTAELVDLLEKRSAR